MFFSHLQPLLKKGITFNFSIQSSDGDLVEVTVVPHNPNAGALALVPRVFTAAPEELDAEFGNLMKGYSDLTKTLAEQLEDARLVMEASAAEASKAASTPAPSKPKTRSVATPSKLAGTAPAGLLTDEKEDLPDTDDVGQDTNSPAPQTLTPHPPPAEMQTLELGFSL